MERQNWLKIDTASIMFSSLSSEKWGRTFRYSAYFKNDINPQALKEACRDLMKYFPSTYAYLKKGFFWNYLGLTNRMPEIREENEYGMLPIVKRRDARPDFRLTYKGNRLNMECSHSLGDGKGIVIYFKALLERYNQLANGECGEYVTNENPDMNISNAFADYYQKNGEKANDKLPNAYHFAEDYKEGFLNLLFVQLSTSKIKELAHKYEMTVTEYISAILILGIIRSREEALNMPVTIAVPVNLRRFFSTLSVRNFTIQSYISFNPNGRRDWSLEDIINATKGQLRKQLKTQELQKIINKYGALVNNPVLRIVPNAIKLPVLRKMQKSGHDCATTIFTNYGACTVSKSLEKDIEKIQFVNGDTRNYGLAVTCSCIGFSDMLSLCFSYANEDYSWHDECVKIFKELGLECSLSSIMGSSQNNQSYEEVYKQKHSINDLKAYFNI